VRTRGFTLIEVLVAIAILAVLALMSWRGIDGMARTQSLARGHADALLRAQGAVAQWIADLNALQQTGEVSALDFDGLVLRMTRSDPDETALDSPGIRVVAWSRLAGLPGGEPQWARWQSPPLRQRDELARAWQRAAQWGRGSAVSEPDPRDSNVRLFGLQAWELHYHRGGAWTNPQSSAGTDPTGGMLAPALGLIPDGVRLTLVPAPGQALAGRITRDWARPTLGAGR